MNLEQIQAKLRRLEKKTGISAAAQGGNMEIDDVIIYEKSPGAAEAAVEEFYRLHPDYDGTIIVLPEKEEFDQPTDL